MKGAVALLHSLFAHSRLVLDIRDAIIAGSTGRMAMILLIYFGPLLRLPRIDAVSLLGSLAAKNKESAVTLGGAIHFSIGVLFALVYAALWGLGIGSPTWYWGIIFGAVHGILVISLLLVGMRLLPQLSSHFNTWTVMIAILLNHIIYGLVVAIVYTS
jgi:hypothetical protein